MCLAHDLKDDTIDVNLPVLLLKQAGLFFYNHRIELAAIHHNINIATTYDPAVRIVQITIDMLKSFIMFSYDASYRPREATQRFKDVGAMYKVGYCRVVG